MLHKCANQDCSRRFRFVTEGKLFVIEASGLPMVHGRNRKKLGLSRRIEYRWLCEECAKYLTIAFEAGRGPVTKPLRSAMEVTLAPRPEPSESSEIGSAPRIS